MPAIRPLYQDPFIPLLYESEALNVTPEQQLYIKKILDKSSSDSRFSDKAFVAIMYVLTHGTTKRPELTSLTPNSAELGDPSFTLHVHGKNFANGSKIIFAGQEEPTTVVSATEVTTGVNMDTWFGPDSIPVMVQNGDGALSDPLMFTFTDGISGAAQSRGQKHLDKYQTEKTATAPQVGGSVSESEKPQTTTATVTKSATISTEKK